MEHLIKNNKIGLDVKLLEKIASFEGDLEKEDVITLREESQYGTETVWDEAKIKELVDDTKEFIDAVKEVLQK